MGVVGLPDAPEAEPAAIPLAQRKLALANIAKKDAGRAPAAAADATAGGDHVFRKPRTAEPDAPGGESDGGSGSGGSRASAGKKKAAAPRLAAVKEKDSAAQAIKRPKLLSFAEEEDEAG